MPTIKISELPAIITYEGVSNTAVLPLSDNGITKKIDLDQITEFVGDHLNAQLEYVVQVPGTTQLAAESTLYVLTQTAAPTTITLPALPSEGNLVTIANLTTRIDVTVARNGNNIMGLAEDFIIDRSQTTVAFCYILSGTAGWIIL